MSEGMSLDAASFTSQDMAAAVKSAGKGASGSNANRRRCSMPTTPKFKAKRVPPEQSGVGVGMVDKGLQRIRSRSSYRLFRELHEFLRAKPDVAAVLRNFHDVLDAEGGFGSRRNAGYAAESLDQVLRDVEDVDDRRNTEVL